MEKRTALSFSSFTGKWTYDVFLSFRGDDTRLNFTDTLYNSLRQKGIHIFIDEEGLRKGEEITPALLDTIQKSRIALVIFSKNYAFSKYCLDELVKILKCREEGQLVWPIFYGVDPSQVRNQTGTYSKALAKHEEMLQEDKERVENWRKALRQAANLSGWHFQHGSQREYRLIAKIVEEVSKNISLIPLHVVDSPVGLDYDVQQVISLLVLKSEVNMIGICGIGGIGKTTIARAVYNSICSDFEGMCFLADIREKAINKHGLVQLQRVLLYEILKENINVSDVHGGIPIIKRRLQQKKVLLVLDDVDKLEQLKVLAGGYDWFGSGSIIIVTTRDKHLLATYEAAKVYEVKPLNNEKALELFSRHAFKNNKVDPSYVDISSRAISYACGLPLALEVIGSHLFGKSLNECCSALNHYEQVPHKKIHDVLKVSYDGLEEHQKEIFLDIACFFNNCDVEYVKQMLHAHGFHAEDGMRVLVDKSLIKIDTFGFVKMHDLIQDMGREIVRQESTLEPGRRSRLWLNEDIVHVLEENTGTDRIEFIKLEAYNNIEVQWNGKPFRKMKNLRILIIENATFSVSPKHLPNSLRVLDWNCYPSPSLPSDFNPKQLEILHMPQSYLNIFQPHKMLESLSIIDFKNCTFLSELSSLSKVPFLTYLCLDNCTSLVKIDDSVGFLDKLCFLSAKGCTKLKSLAPCIMLTSLEILNLQGCSCLESFPEVLGKMEKIREIYLDNTSIDKLPSSIRNLVGLEQLSLKGCKRLNQVPGIILPKVKVILGYGHMGYNFFAENLDEENGSLEMSPGAMVIREIDLDDGYFAFLDVYYPYMSPNNVIQVCSPDPHMHHYFDFLFHKLSCLHCYRTCKKSSMHFLFRRKFPKIAVCCSIIPNLKVVMALFLKFSVLINGIKQLSSTCNYIFSTWSPILWCDLRCKVEGIFSEHEWNEVEILFELEQPIPSSKIVTVTQNWVGRETLHWSLIGIYEEGNSKEDVRFKSPTSILNFSGTESSSTLPSCLYYTVRYGNE